MWGTSRALQEQKFWSWPALDAELQRVLPHIDCRSDGYTVAATIELRNLAGDVRGRSSCNQQKTGSIKIFPVYKLIHVVLQQA